MNTVFFILSAFICFRYVTPFQKHHVYADTQNAGYVALNKAQPSPIGFNMNQRKYMGVSASQIFQKANEDRDMNYARTTNEDDIDNRNYGYTVKQKVTESPTRLRIKDKFASDSRNANLVHKNQNAIYIAQSIQSGGKEFRKDYIQNSYRDQQYTNKADIYDGKINNVKVNVRKSQIATDPQKVKLNGNKQLTSVSMQKKNENNNRVANSMLVDKTLQKNANFKDRNAKIMSRFLDDMAQKVSDRRGINGEYRKRHIGSTYDTKRSVLSENMRKYIGKDISVTKDNTEKDMPRYRDGQIEDSTYALFYNTAPGNIDNNNEAFLIKPVADDEGSNINNKDKRVFVNYENEVDLKKAKPKNFNTVKLKKKVESYSNYRM